ncbi:MAG: ATP-grasp domain-containing protein [Phycisphaerales bacterium]
MNTIIIIGATDDLHTQAVAQHLMKNGINVEIIDARTDSSPYSISYMSRGQQCGVTFGERAFPLAQIHGVWCRRIFRPDPVDDGQLAAQRHTRWLERRHMINAFVQFAHDQGLRVANAPEAQSAGALKPLQLARASAAGLGVPLTLMTSNAGEFRDCVAEAAGMDLVIKGFEQGPNQVRFARLVRADDLERADLLAHAPVIVQEYVAGTSLRVTVVGEEVFAAEIADAPSGGIDWRRDTFPTAKAVVLADDEVETILFLHRDLWLVYGAYDFIRRADGRLMFLEVNPAGQFLFVEVQTGQQISRAIAEYLSGATGSHHCPDGNRKGDCGV